MLLLKSCSMSPITMLGLICHGLADESARRRDHLEETGNSQPMLPFGVTMIATAWRDDWLCEIASRFHQATGLGCGPRGHRAGTQSPVLANGHAGK